MPAVEIASLLVKPTDTIRSVIATIDAGELQIALVVDGQRRLLGTVSDGDVRRALLRGVTLDESVEGIMNASPLAVTEDVPRSAVEGLMKASSLRRIPVLDDERVVKDLALPQAEVREARPSNLVVLMAGGLGTRLAELTDDCPKPLLKVGSKPILETILERFVEQGFHRFLISVNYKAEMIEEYFRDGSHWGVEIDYLREHKRLGTAGALTLLPAPPDEPILVMNGDLLTSVNFREMLAFHREMKLEATMAVREYDVQIPFGVVEIDGHRVRALVEKPMNRYFVNGGIYVLDPSCLDLIPPDTFYDMPSVLDAMLQGRRRVGSFPIHEYWLDVGRIDDFRTANEAYASVFAK